MKDESPAVSSRPREGRNARGHFAPGNPHGEAHRFGVGQDPANRRTHGVRAFEQRGPAAVPADLRGSVQDFIAQVTADRGGDLTAIEQGYVRRLSEVETIVRLLGSDLASRGVFTQKGKVRSTLPRLLEAIDRWDRLAQRIGVERKARPVPTIAEYLDARARESEDRP